jgi:hypothetical protein
MSRPFNPYAGFDIWIGPFMFRASPVYLTVWKDGLLIDGPTRIGYTPRTEEQLHYIGFQWILKECNARR